MIAIARVDDIPPDGLRFTYPAGPFEDEGILLRLPDGAVRAYKNECRHLAMRLDDREPRHIWDDANRHLVCSSHGAAYRPEDGLCVSGPCRGSHLRQVPVVIRDGEVFVDTAATGAFFEV
jgi:nitrite reductase/ring-hydroxylating ferredoxin subunit